MEELDLLNTSDASSTLEPTKKPKHPIIEIVEFAFIALLIVVPVRMFIAQPFIVSGDSMKDTFHSGEYLIIDQISYRFNEPNRGDVVVFHYPQDPSKFFIKRIIAMPGDSIDIKGNVVKVTTADGKEMTLDEPYVRKMAENSNVTETLGEREYFVMGDNRDESSDSRVWGVLQKEKIVGRAFIRLFPFNEAGILPGEFDIIQHN